MAEEEIRMNGRRRNKKGSLSDRRRGFLVVKKLKS
jgi:hypothetical protein